MNYLPYSYSARSNVTEKRPVKQDRASEKSSPVSLASVPSLCIMNVSVLAGHCMEELRKYRQREPFDNRYSLELFHRAMLQNDQDAWAWLQVCFNEMVLGWIRRHPSRETASRFESEENYVAQAFERFWQATAYNQKLEFNTLAAALHYLRASLNSVILDTLRVYLRPKEAPLPEPGFPGEPLAEDREDTSELWELIQDMLPHAREKRLGYLLYYCGLKPRDVVRYCPQEFSDVREVYGLRRNIVGRLLRNMDQIRWRLGIDEEVVL